MRLTRSIVLTLLATTGCSLSHATDDAGPAPDVIVPALDAPRAIPDAPPATESPLARILRCGFSDADALAAMVRHQSCIERRENASVGGFYEAWEAGLFSALEPAFTSFEPGLGCDAWRCRAAATSCMDVAVCDTMALPCRDEPFCSSGGFVTCGPSGARSFDCSAVGATCTPEGCLLDGCLFRPGENYQLTCDGSDLVLCEGAARVDCAATGRSCRGFAVGGEVPTTWCSTTGFGGAGAYGNAIECAADGTIAFMSVSGRVVAFDCRAAGYTGCDEWGCVE